MAKGRVPTKKEIDGTEYQFGTIGKIKEMLVEAIQYWPDEKRLVDLVNSNSISPTDYAEPVEKRPTESLDQMTKLDAIAFILNN